MAGTTLASEFSTVIGTKTPNRINKLVERVIVVIDSSTVSTGLHMTNVASITGSPNTNTSTNTTTIHNTATTTQGFNSTLSSVTVQLPSEPPSNNSSNNLRYLFLIFLVVGLIIIGIVARYIFVKRKRAIDLQLRDSRRHHALQMDMIERGPFDGGDSGDGIIGPNGAGGGPSAGFFHSMGLFRSRYSRPSNHDRNHEDLGGDAENLPPYPVHELPPYEHHSMEMIEEHPGEEDTRHSESSESKYSSQHVHGYENNQFASESHQYISDGSSNEINDNINDADDRMSYEDRTSSGYLRDHDEDNQ